jgi:gamma-glutamylcyclotransferase (GGCT)/AIG2-like uncharacterized protein YtfP
VGGLSNYVFGYGSLAAEVDAATATVSRLRGYRRVWGVAADNRRAIPGYKRYVRRGNGTAAMVFVAFLDLREDDRATVNGLLIEADVELLAELDRRERNYDRVEVTAAVESPPNGRVWAYVGSADGRDRFDAGAVEDNVVVAQSYLTAVTAGFHALGTAEYDAFLASTDLDGIPVVDLERVDLPPEPAP